MKHPHTGGSYIRDPKTGKLTLQNPTAQPDPTAKKPAPAKPPATKKGNK